MFSIFRKKRKLFSLSADPTYEEIHELTIRIKLLYLRTLSPSAKLYHVIHTITFQYIEHARIFLKFGDSWFFKLYKKVFYNKNIKKYIKQIDSAKNEIHELIETRFYLFRIANHILDQNKCDIINLQELQIFGIKIEEKFSINLLKDAENIKKYCDFLIAYLNYLDYISLSFISKLESL